MSEQGRPTVAVLGAGGLLGFGMATSLAREGIPVRAWNRSREKAEPLAGDGVVVTDTAADAVDGADVVLSILFDAAATKDVLFGADGALAARTGSPVWLQMATLGEAGTRACIDLAGGLGLPFVDAPVLGTKGPALEGKLTILASGDERIRPKVAPVLDAVGARTIWAGEAGAGTRLKITVNAWLVSLIEGLAETFAFAEGIGVDPRQFLDAVGGSGIHAPYLDLKGDAILHRDFRTSFSLDGGAKDAALVVDLAEQHGLDLPVLRAIADRLREGADENGDLDVIATYLTSAKRR